MRVFKSQSGFTLVELMITVVVLAILVALAAPSFADLIDRNRLKKQMTGVVDVFEFARGEAQKRIRRPPCGLTRGQLSKIVERAAGQMVPTRCARPRRHRRAQTTKRARWRYDVGVASVARHYTLAANTNVTLAYSFRGIVTGFAGGAATETFTLRSPRGYQMSITLNAIGRAAVCSTGGAIWGYPSC